MKIIVTTLLAALMLVGATVSDAGATTAGYTCKYRMVGVSGVYIKIHGAGNLPTFCREISRGWSIRFYGSVPGTLRCTFQMDTVLDIRMSVYTRESWKGRYACSNLEDSLTSWTRL
jgi:hypothetical protein